ncbi:MAG: hypothetical protein EBW77_09115 [Burkholderiaceae bacterium]|nr:hypothetical protein [Burkholderiaceae bacterium]
MLGAANRMIVGLIGAVSSGEVAPVTMVPPLNADQVRRSRPEAAADAGTNMHRPALPDQSDDPRRNS